MKPKTETELFYARKNRRARRLESLRHQIWELTWPLLLVIIGFLLFAGLSAVMYEMGREVAGFLNELTGNK